MILLENKVNVGAPDGTWLYGTLVDDPGSNTGTPVDVELLSDVLQTMSRIFDESGLTANGNLDNEANGWQLYNAMRKMFRPYRVYTALMSQAATAAPTAEVLGMNDIGTIVWTYNSPGNYTGTLASAFPETETWVYVKTGIGTFLEAQLSRTTDNTVTLQTYVSSASANNVLSNTSLEIRVYDLILT